MTNCSASNTKSFVLKMCHIELFSLFLLLSETIVYLRVCLWLREVEKEGKKKRRKGKKGREGERKEGKEKERKEKSKR